MDIEEKQNRRLCGILVVEAQRKRENINQFYMDGENESNIQRKSLAGRADQKGRVFWRDCKTGRGYKDDDL